MEASQ